MEKLIEEFNRLFAGAAKASTDNGKLEITIGTVTMVISPEFLIGAHNNPIA